MVVAVVMVGTAVMVAICRGRDGSVWWWWWR